LGAATIRNDNPRLLVRAKERDERVARGLPPIKVTVTGHAQLDVCAKLLRRR
jgi:5-amino-6-(5-phosphoribosylamino)uracil reductase